MRKHRIKLGLVDMEKYVWGSALGQIQPRFNLVGGLRSSEERATSSRDVQ